MINVTDYGAKTRRVYRLRGISTLIGRDIGGFREGKTRCRNKSSSDLAGRARSLPQARVI